MWYKNFNFSSQPRKKLDLFTTFLVVVFLGTLSFNPLYSCSNNHQRNIEVCFTPGGDGIRLVEKVIGQAEQQILVQAYYFTSPRIAQALIAAHEKGVIVKMLVDRSQLTKKHAQLKKLLRGGITILVDKVPGIAHNKVMITDDWYVLTGSYNWTQNAEHKNAENLILITDKNTNQVYKRNWEQRAQQAEIVSMDKIGNN